MGRPCVGRALLPSTLTMRKKLNPENTSLTGIRVLVGRAKHQSGSLSAELCQRGAEVFEIPFIEIRTPNSFTHHAETLKSHNAYDWLILTSANGVDAMCDRMKKTREGHDFSFKPALSEQSEPKGAVKGAKSKSAL